MKECTLEDIIKHLNNVDKYYIPTLSSLVNINDYAQKIYHNAELFIDWDYGEVAGLVAMYCNDIKTKQAYITNVSVCKKFWGNGIAKKLLIEACNTAKRLDFRNVILEVNANNKVAIRTYEEMNFVIYKKKNTSLFLKRRFI